jgi:hypothetical protein
MSTVSTQMTHELGVRRLAARLEAVGMKLVSEATKPGEFSVTRQRRLAPARGLVPHDLVMIPQDRPQLRVFVKLHANGRSSAAHTSLWRAVGYAVEALALRRAVYLQLIDGPGGEGLRTLFPVTHETIRRRRKVDSESTSLICPTEWLWDGRMLELLNDGGGLS